LVCVCELYDVCGYDCVVGILSFLVNSLRVWENFEIFCWWDLMCLLLFISCR